jgi:hypothetical protein
MGGTGVKAKLAPASMLLNLQDAPQPSALCLKVHVFWRVLLGVSLCTVTCNVTFTLCQALHHSDTNDIKAAFKLSAD